MTAPVISVLPDAPQRGVDSQEVFTSKANALVDSLATLVSETNTMGTWMNTTASEVDSDRIASAASATAAASSSSSASSSATTATTKASEASSSATSASSSAVVASTAATTATTKASEASSSASSASTSATTATTKASEASASAASASGSANTSSTQASIAIQKATEAGNSANSAAASAANAALSLGDYRGDYYAPTSYIAGQSVSYNGSIYIAKQGTTGNLPTNTTYWFKGTGAAAVYDVTASPTDTTAGRLLKVGDFGAGVRISTSGVVNWDSLTTEGSYFVQAVVGNTNAPWGAALYSGYLEVKGTSGLAYQTAWIIRSEDPQMYTRIFNGTNWSVWKEMVRVGDYGIVGNLAALPLATVDDTSIPTGNYWSTPDTLGVKPLGASYGYVTIFNEANNDVARQVYRETSNNDVYERFRTTTSGGWQPWVRLLKVGDGGVIESIPFNGNIDTIIVNGTYKLLGDVTGIPEGASGLGDHLVHQTWDANAATQQYYQYNEKKMYTRQYKDGAWLSWERVLQTNDITTSATDTTAGRLLTVGAKIEQLNVDGTNVKYEAPVKPTLDLDFANQDFTVYSKTEGFVKKPLADIVSQGRATAGSSVDAIGGVTEFGTGENRFTFDGETGEALGYLSEESRTNLLTNSEFPDGLSDAPSRSGLLTLSSMNLGNGDINAIAFGHDGATGSHAYKNYLATAGNTYSFSVFVEMSDGLAPSFGSSTNASAFNDFVFVFNGGVVNPLSYIVNKLVGSLYRVEYSMLASGGIGNIGIIKYATNSPRTFKVTGYQLEVGSFPTSYIRTLGTAVTRSADSMTRTLGQEWNPNEGTFVVEFEIYRYLPSGAVLVSANGTNKIWLYIRSPTNDLRMFDGSTLSNSGFSVGSGGIFRVAISSTQTTMRFAVNGQFVNESSTDGTLVSGRSSIEFFRITEYLTCKFARYYPRAFDAATLQRLSRI